jgi:hypothetical protein
MRLHLSEQPPQPQSQLPRTSERLLSGDVLR